MVTGISKRGLRTAFAALAAMFFVEANAAEPPRLIINITVGSMRAEVLEKYAENFGDGGLRKLTSEGAVFTDARYDCMQTTTPVSLATLSTGATPATHGVVAEQWFDYTTNKPIKLAADERVRDFGGRETTAGHSPANLIAPTLADAMMRADSSCRVVSIAATPVPAVIQSGKRGMSFWLDCDKGRWTTSSYYLPVLPSWVQEYNTANLHSRFLFGAWTGKFAKNKYINRRATDISLPELAGTAVNRRAQSGTVLSDKEKILRTPAGNTLVFDFAKYAVKVLNMGNDEHPDLLNIYLDASRNIAERYGCESVEYEDMLYSLDSDLKDFLAYLNVHLKDAGTVAVVFTAGHGTAPAYDAAAPVHDRFNARQFEVILNAFLSAKYGQGQWVLGYSDRSLYLNRKLANDMKISIAEIQNEAATFAMQFRGVSHALSAAVLQSNYFGGGYSRKIQNGFYPRRSGDVIIDLMPEWIEERSNCRSHSGSMYTYDTCVPLVFWGTGVAAGRHDEEVDMTSVAPTEARMLKLDGLSVAEGKALNF